ncbi:MAG: anaerobic ribonucleoside-triphosphate reductase activating protein [Mangrovibacterium sp.]
MTKLSILQILHDTTVDGPGFRTSIYASGCAHRCASCHNPQSWDESHGELCTIDEILTAIKEAEFAQVTFSGGDPLYQVEGFTALARRIKEETDKNVWCYTGYAFEQVLQSERLAQILPFIDVLVDGRYEAEHHSIDLPFRGSSNQRIIDVVQSLNREEPVWVAEYQFR